MGNRILRSELIREGELAPILIEWKNVKTIRMRWSAADNAFHISMPMWTSRQVAIDFMGANRKWMVSTKQRMMARNRTVRDVLADPLERAAFARYVKQRLDYWCEQMGVSNVRLRFRNTNAQWGSWSSKTRTVSVSINLLGRPRECVDYLLIHELAHSFHPDHSASFWNHVKRYCPNYLELRKLLKK